MPGASPTTARRGRPSGMRDGAIRSSLSGHEEQLAPGAFGSTGPPQVGLDVTVEQLPVENMYLVEVILRSCDPRTSFCQQLTSDGEVVRHAGVHTSYP